ncbi:ATPase with role in protein import into the ER [Linnemannia gamsii]|uniref:ATPase with role in protein import into the ER n=1 Tax=Linnemannia gamsii TaxID=64522 RepID=A0ABQ7K989_9FUNG|nr:ATPase with role in protein import into the ER [Linnemannia gamsii]
MLAKTTLVALTAALALLTVAVAQDPPILVPQVVYEDIDLSDDLDLSDDFNDDNYDIDYKPAVDASFDMRATPSPTGWNPYNTGFYYPTRTDAPARATWAPRAPRRPYSLPPYMATTRPVRMRPTYGYGYGDAVPSPTVSPGDDYYPPQPPAQAPTRTPYRYHGGNSEAQQQQRPFGVDQNSTEDEYVPGSTTVVNIPVPTCAPSDDPYMEYFQEQHCRPSGKTTRYIGVDLREDSFAVGYVNSAGKVELIPNEDGKLYTPAQVRFIEGGRRALVGDAAFTERGDEHSSTMDSVVDLSGMRGMFDNYPENVRLSLGYDRFSEEVDGGITYASTPLDPEVSENERWMWSEVGPYREQGYIMAVVLQRAIDMAERHMALSSSYEKVAGVVVTHQRENNDVGDDSYVNRRHITNRMWEGERARESLWQLQKFDHYSESLSLAAAHIEFFESKVQRDPFGGENTYLNQTVLLYNLRESTEDMTVMQYIKGTFGLRPFHLKLLSGYLPPHQDGLIDEEFERYLVKTILGRYSRVLGGRKFFEHPDKVGLRRTFFKMDSFSEASAGGTADKGVEFWLGPKSKMSIPFKDWKNIRLQFLKERLAKMAERILADSGLESKDIDHLVVADTTSFDSQSIEAMESVFGLEGKKKIVKAVDPRRAVAEGIVTIAGILTKESPDKVPWYCDDQQID